MNDASYENQLANLKRSLRIKTPEEAIHHYARLLLDTSSDEVEIETLAKQVLDPKWVDGDSYGVPSTVDIVERLVAKVKELSK